MSLGELQVEGEWCNFSGICFLAAWMLLVAKVKFSSNGF